MLQPICFLKQTVLPGRVCFLHYSICAASVHAYPTAPYAASRRICSTAAWAAPGHCSTVQQTVLPGQIYLSYSSHCCPWRCLFYWSLFVCSPAACTVLSQQVVGLQHPLLQLKTSSSRCCIVRFVCLQEHVLHLYMCFCVTQYCICLQKPVWCCTFTYVSVYYCLCSNLICLTAAFRPISACASPGCICSTAVSQVPGVSGHTSLCGTATKRSITQRLCHLT